MDFVLLLVTLVLTVAPFHLLVSYELARSEEPQHLRRLGLFLESFDVFEAIGPAIGSYLGQPIPASVRLYGIDYEYDRIAPQSYRHRLREHELMLQPGLVYVARG